MPTSKIARSKDYQKLFDSNGEVKNLRKSFPILLSAAKE
jgi:hypothetical protein